MSSKISIFNCTTCHNHLEVLLWIILNKIRYIPRKATENGAYFITAALHGRFLRFYLFYLFVCWLIYLFIYLFIDICPSIYRFICVFIYLFVYSFIREKRF